jgi:hypothetical protein
MPDRLGETGGVRRPSISAVPSRETLEACRFSTQKKGRRTQMPTIGGNINDLEALIRSFRQSATTVDEIVTGVARELAAADWIGPVADRFRSSWDTEFVPTLRRVEEGFREAAASLSQARDHLARALY